MKRLLVLYFLSISLLAFAHEGHDHRENVQLAEMLGRLHLLLLHFPIALINMLAISELLWKLFKKPIFEYASQFMLIAAAIITPFTSLFGYLYSYSAPYEGIMHTYLMWHMWLGIATTLLIIVLAFLKDWQTKLYYFGLLLLLLLVNTTSSLGGRMTFGPFFES